jgi:predicted NACHT family NTPase
MAEKIYYPWKRFWCARSGSISLADGGYLSDPEAKWGKVYNPDLVTFETLSSSPCLALLGEPGIGKTKALEAERAELVSRIKAQGNQPFFLDLRSYSDEGRLVQKLFASPEFVAWQSGTHQLHIFLDSLDECLLRIDTLANLLVDEFRQYQDQAERLYVRIACRTAVWPTVLEEGLREIWGEDAVGVHELVPLRRVDVAEAARAEGFSPDDFLKELGQKKVVPLAIKPVTLGFLLNIYRDDGQFSENQTLQDLYLKGCRILCDEEENTDPRAPGRKGNLEIEQRLIIASRIAAVTVFANRDAVWMEGDRGKIPGEDVPYQELVQGYERADGRPFEANAAAIVETLGTGLFSSRGPSRMGWAHQTYAEFLAAWYLKRHNLNLEQILSLILHPDGRVIPQLQETVAWLASMMPEVFEEVMKIDPDVLLQSDVASRTEKDRSNLVDSLLRAYDEERLPYRFKQYQHLNHAEIGRQLRAYIRDLGKSESSRLVAIDIARDCHVEVVQDSLADITLDPMQPYIVRTHAAHTICAIGNEKIKERLKPLALGQTGDDPNDDLKGYGLRAIWPQELISVEVLLNHLSQPQERGGIPIIGGVYQDFVAAEFAQHLLSSDLPVVLQWLEQLPKRYNLSYPFTELADSVMLKAWQNIDEPGVLEAFARVAKLKLERYEGILSDLPSQVYTAASSDHNHDADIESFLKDSDEKRRQLIEAVVLLLPDSTNDCSWLVHNISSQDIFWLIDNITSSKSTNIWIKLLSQALTWHNLRWKNVQINDAILQACSSTPLLRLEFEFDITPIELNSEKAKQFKAGYLKYQNKLEQPKPKALLDPPPKQRVLAILEKVEEGYPELWWKVGMAMTLTPTTIYWDNNAAFEPDLTKLFGWSDSDAETKLRILETAKKYLDVVEPEISGLLKPRNLSNDNFAIYQAIYLLEKQETDFTSTIPRDTWGKLILIILESINFSYRARREKDEYCQRILRAAYKSNIDVFIGALASLMCQMNYQPRTRHMDDIYRCTSDLLNEHISIPILRRVDSHNLNAGMLEVLLSDSFNQDIDKASARDIAISLISSPISKTGEGRAKAIVAARMLLTHADNSGWSAFWSAMQQDLEFGREVLEAVSSESLHTGRIEQQLKEEFLADLYIFLVKQYPENSHSKPSAQKLSGVEAQILGEFDGVRMWKNYIPQRIQARGTQEACDALKKTIHELPTQKEKIQPLLLECEQQVRRSTWRWKKPEEFLELVLVQEPSNSELSSQLDVLDQRTKEMKNDPKIDRSINIRGANVSGNFNTGDGAIQNKPDSPDEKKGINCGNCLALISILVALAAIPIGIFNPEINQQIKQWFNQSAPVKIEPQSKPPS